MNQADRSFENATKHNPPWTKLWKHNDPKLPPGLQVEALRCPHHGKPYKEVPGYVSGYGCPVCKGIGPSHVKVVAICPDLLREAYEDAWNAGHFAGEHAGYRQAAIEGGDEGCRFGV
jgi:hypothetical protein